MKIVFNDPTTGNVVWRMTTDGANNGMTNAIGDQSSESRAFSHDSTKITYYKYNKRGSFKPKGMYMMDIASGLETFLAPTDANDFAPPIFSKDGTEVYYYDGDVIRAVNVSNFQTRTIVNLPGIGSPQKLTLNADGTYIAAHDYAGSKRTAIFTPQGSFHPNWRWDSGMAGDDGTQWHPINPRIVFATRQGTEAIWNIDTLQQLGPSGILKIAHTCWHPNGDWIHWKHMYEISSGDLILSGRTSQYSHPNCNPMDGALGFDARMVFDGRPDVGGAGGGIALLYIATQNQVHASRSEDPAHIVATHYSSSSNNNAHTHPHYSWNGQFILWQSDMRDLSQGAPPGGTGGNIDLFILPLKGPSTGGPNPPTGLRLVQ